MLIEPLLVFAKVGLLTIGGGLAMIPLLQEEIVSRGWITIDEFTQMISIAEMTPGPIIVNLATFVGYRLGGIPSAIACTLGVMLPSFVIVTLISSVLFRHRDSRFMSGLFAVVRPAVVGLITGGPRSRGRFCCTMPRAAPPHSKSEPLASMTSTGRPWSYSCAQ